MKLCMIHHLRKFLLNLSGALFYQHINFRRLSRMRLSDILAFIGKKVIHISVFDLKRTFRKKCEYEIYDLLCFSGKHLFYLTE